MREHLVSSRLPRMLYQGMALKTLKILKVINAFLLSTFSFIDFVDSILPFR